MKKNKKLKVFKSILNYTTPFCITTAFVIGAVKISGGGFPFIRDDLTKYKCSNLKYITNQLDEEKVSYETENSFDEKNKDYNNSIIIYSPWTLEDDKYTRNIKYFDLKDIDDNYIAHAIRNSDLDYICKKYPEYNEEIETINIVSNNYDDYIIDSDIYFIDSSDYIIEKESKNRNNTITILELLFESTLGICASIAKNNNKKKTLSLGGDKYDD